MLRLRKDQPSLWESVLPDEVLKLSEELTRVDALLEDERFFAPFRERFSCRWGRPTVPVASYLRLMYLKFRYKLGYKALGREVKDSFSWRRFCHLPFNDPVPDASTLVKLTRKYGETTRSIPERDPGAEAERGESDSRKEAAPGHLCSGCQYS